MPPVGMRDLMHTMLEAVASRYRLPSVPGLSWATVYLGSICVAIVFSVVSGGEFRGTRLMAVLGVFVFMAMWWVWVIGFFRSAISPEQYQAVPHLRRAAFWLVFSLWIAASWFASLAFVLYQWFVLAVFSFVVAASIRHRRWREICCAVVFLSWSVVACIIVYPQFKGFPIHWIEFVALAFFVMAGTGALIGILRTMPLLGVGLLLIWTTPMFYGKLLFGLTFDQLLGLIYQLTSQGATHFMVAAFLGMTLLVGMFGLSADRATNRRVPGQNFMSQLEYASLHSVRFARWIRKLSLHDRLLRMASFTGSSTERLLSHAFGKIHHWSFAWLPATFLLLWFVVTTAVTGNSLGGEGGYMFSAIATMSASAMLGVLPQTFNSITKSEREQQMLSLTTRWDQSKAMNVVLIKNSARYWLAFATVGLAFVGLCGLFLHAELIRYLQSISLVFATAGLCFAATLWRFSHAGTSRSAFRLIPWLMVAASPLAVDFLYRFYKLGVASRLLEQMRADPSESTRNILEPLLYEMLRMERLADLAPYAAMLAVVSIVIAWRVRRFLGYGRVLPAGNALA
jgi:NADH:ubiquinone oxidoreductase subunit K